MSPGQSGDVADGSGPGFSATLKLVMLDFIPLLGTSTPNASFRIRLRDENHGSLKPDPNL